MWCEPNVCPIECFTSFRFLPHAIIHVALFYIAALVIAVLKSLRCWPSPSAFDKRFADTFYVAWHCPVTLTSIPFSIMGLRGAYDLWVSGNVQQQFGNGSMSHPLITEAGVWFFTFIGVDTILCVLHRMVDKEMLLHHAIFGLVCFLVTSTCAFGITTAVLLSQELSTPFLNVFLLFRAFKGVDSSLTIVTFLAFSAFFYAVRVVLNSFAMLLFVRVLYSALTGAPTVTMSSFEQGVMALLAVPLLAGQLLQLKWAKLIATKIISAASGKKQEKPGKAD